MGGVGRWGRERWVGWAEQGAGQDGLRGQSRGWGRFGSSEFGQVQHTILGQQSRHAHTRMLLLRVSVT